MVNRFSDDFIFIATTPVPMERKEMGYADLNHAYPFVICAYERSKTEIDRLIFESDVVIQGGSETRWIKRRLEETNKLTFRYIERLFKTGYFHLLDPRAFYNYFNSHSKYNKKNFYLLAAGGYVARDCQIIHAYKNKMLKWGYFPQTKRHEDIEKIVNNRNNDIISLMWAGRFIDWKHSEYAILSAEKLRKKGYRFVLKMVGTGPLLKSSMELVDRLNLSAYVEFTGPKTPEQVRELMEQTSIYLFTSDYQEGWGAVLNEAMNSGCAVVASHAIGATPFLVKDGHNGLVFKSDSCDDLFQQIEKLINDVTLRKQISINAYYTIEKVWNSEVAAERFVEVCQCLLNNRPLIQYAKGPCSIAVPIPQRKQYKKIKRGNE